MGASAKEQATVHFKRQQRKLICHKLSIINLQLFTQHSLLMLHVLLELTEDPYSNVCYTYTFTDPLHSFTVTQGFVANRPMCL